MSESFRRAVLLDSSAILALADASDRHHREAIAIAARLGAERRPVFVTHAIELEAHALLLRKLGRGPAREWLLRGGLSVVRATRGEEDAARELIASHEDKDWSLAVTPCHSSSSPSAVRRGRSPSTTTFGRSGPFACGARSSGERRGHRGALMRSPASSRPALVLAGTLLVGAVLAAVGHRYVHGRCDVLVVNATGRELDAVSVSLADRRCDLGPLPPLTTKRCVGRAWAEEGEVRLEARWPGGRAVFETGKYVDPNAGWSGLVVIDELDPPRAVATSADDAPELHAN